MKKYPWHPGHRIDPRMHLACGVQQSGAGAYRNSDDNEALSEALHGKCVVRLHDSFCVALTFFYLRRRISTYGRYFLKDSQQANINTAGKPPVGKIRSQWQVLVSSRRLGHNIILAVNALYLDLGRF